MAHGIRRVVCFEIVHDDFNRVTANLTVLVGEPGASGTSRFNEQFDLHQLARNVGVRDVWVAPANRKMPEPFREALGLRSGQALTDKAPARWRAFREQPELSYLLRAQPARRIRREDGAGSGDTDEDEGAEAPGGLLCLVYGPYTFWTYRLDGCAVRREAP